MSLSRPGMLLILDIQLIFVLRAGMDDVDSDFMPDFRMSTSERVIESASSGGISKISHANLGRDVVSTLLSLYGLCGALRRRRPHATLLHVAPMLGVSSRIILCLAFRAGELAVPP